MSKRKVRFVEEREMSDGAALAMSKRSKKETPDADASDLNTAEDELETAKKEDFKSRHTLESDEEEEEDHERLDIDTVEGQEEVSAVGDFDEGQAMTAFNMKEEMGEGHFDSTGNFIFNKKGEELKDAWLDGIDWTRVKKQAGDNWEKIETPTGSEPAEGSAIKLDKVTIYQQILSLIQPKETVARAMKRLGGGQSSSDIRRRKWEKKKAKENSESEKEGETVPQSKVLELTELVDSLVASGELEAYEYTFEKIKHLLDSKEKEIPANDDDALDIFAADLDKKEGSGDASGSKDAEPSAAANKESDAEGGVRWEFKWNEEADSEVHGPCSSEQMAEWSEGGYFKEGVFVRKLGQGPSAPFYSSRRIDFDLYT